MNRLALALALLLAPAVASAATHTVYMNQPTGGTYTAYPADESLADWATYDVAATAGTGANVGRYSFVLDDAVATEWVVFSGSSQPASWDLYVGTITLDSLSLTAGDIEDIVDGLVAAGAVASPVSADIISPTRTWVANGRRAQNIIEVTAGFVGTLALKPDLNNATTINGVTVVSITGAATVTATNLSVDRSRTQAHFTVPALSTVGTYTVVVTVTTVDGQTIKTTGTLKVY